MQVQVVREPEEIERAALSQGIIQFNRQAVPDLEQVEAEVPFHVLARDRDRNVRGGIRANCYWNTLHIELLWIDDACRGSGLGRDLIEKAEAFARENDCANALVETTSWQAKPFYEKNGYRLIATLADRPKGHASHYLSKSLV
jgi:ribosomal protein S18 acetylase RimI-like enzyme